MTELIGNWLLNSIRCNIKCTPETLGRACYDGRIFAQILVTYNVCNSDYLKLIYATVDKRVALSNLKKLCVWFKLLGISTTDEFLNEIVNENGSASLSLLYELFVRLENQESMLYMDSKKMQRVLSESTDKFEVTPAPEIEPEKDAADEKQYLRDLLNTMKGVMESAEKNSLKRFIVSGIKERAEQVKQQIMNEQRPRHLKIHRGKKLHPHLDIQAKINEFENFLESPEGLENQNQTYECDPGEYITYLKLKRSKVAADQKLKIKLGKNSMDDAWKKILKNQEMELKNLLSMKLLKQSEYEKQMTLRLKRLRLKYQKFIDTRNMVMSTAEKQEAVNEFRSSFTAIKEEERTQIEKRRIKELHQRLFKEKSKFKKRLDREACRIIIEDIVDFAMLKHDYNEQNGTKMPRNQILELKLLFMKGIRLIPHDIIPKPARDVEETPLKLDDERLEELAEYDFYLYMYRIGPWHLTEATDDEQLNITGYIVHRLLDFKYNFGLSAGEPADLPTYNYKIFLQRINDTFTLEKLKHYLSKFRIEVFDIAHVINHFLNDYKSYVGIDIIKDSSRLVNPMKTRSNSVAVIKIDKNKFKPWPGSSDKMAKDRTYVNKGVQFPSNEKLFKDKTLSTEIGKCIYEILQTGELLSDSFLCYLIIEYLKHFKDIDGWVLINYPENITQLAILEFMFTGREVPYMPRITQNIRKLIASELNKAMPKGEERMKSDHPSLYEDISGESREHPVEQFSVEELIELKNSKILPRAHAPPKPLKFESFFTKVIILQHEGEKRGISKASRSFPKFSPAEGEENSEEKITLENFYGSLEVSSQFSYKYFDTTTLKKLLTLILNMSTSKQNEYLKSIEKGVDVMRKSVPPDKWERSLEPVKFKRNALDDWVLKTFLENEEGGLEETNEEEAVEEEMLIYPGHKDWNYTEFNISDYYIASLGTVWESIEYFFTYNLKKCFVLLRTVGKRLMPYRNYVRAKAEECLSLEDDRTETVTNFQLMLNKIKDHYRSLDTMKNEMHNRILKLQCDLWKMTDVKKFYCEQVLELVLNQNWISSHLTNILQVYGLILQAEIDRFADTMQLIDDYYCSGLLGKIHDDRIMKIILPKIGLKSDKKDEPNRKTSRQQVSAPINKRSKVSEDKHLSKMDFDGSKSGLYYNDYEAQENPALQLLKALIVRLTRNVHQIKAICEFRSNTISDKIKAQSIKSESKQRASRDTLPVKKHFMKDTNLTSESQLLFINKVALEWAFAIDNEVKRVLYRIDLIEKRASADINEDSGIIKNTFKEFQLDITNLYHSQTVNIDKVCDLMRAAVEEEVKIQPLVVLKNDSLDIDPSVILFPNPPPPSPSPLVEIPTGFKFTISQLTNLFYKLVYVAPCGIIEQSFVLILEDMASIGHETGHSYLPHCWSDLSSERIKEIVHRMYGDKVIIDWRLFIIFGLDLGYPTLEDILEMRYDFRLLDRNLNETVTYEQYTSVFLWFENKETLSINQDLYIAKAKELLFKLFQINENLINYTELLLAFCRDYDPREGFVKALALTEGCATITWKQDLFRETFQIEKENEKYDVACGILTIVIAGVYQIVDSVIITEVPNEEPTGSQQDSQTTVFPGQSRKKSNRAYFKKMKKTASNMSNLGDCSGQEICAAQQDVLEQSGGEESSLMDLGLPEKEKTQVLWKSDVYFSTIFSLLMLDIHHFALSTDQIYEPFRLEENLKRIYREKGKDHTMKLYHLLSDVYIHKIFTSYRCFQAFSLPQLLMKLAKDDCSSVADHN
ncbi:sperm flagellar protein 2 [Halyomorpha halys]|uniref:sperm flagellar protein 2 n=1 Tax=Halyomorpha halys TaxID=286706 RepID=UPI0006D5092E|nr:sperm flagellar protein 2-like [Halyomorpha halys]